MSLFNKNKKQNVTTLIGKDSSFVGEITFSGGLHLDGTVKGKIVEEEGKRSLLQIGEGGVVEGEIHVSSITTNGRIVGNVHADRVELLPKAKVNGDIHYRVVDVGEGAEINGNLIYERDINDLGGSEDVDFTKED